MTSSYEKEEKSYDRNKDQSIVKYSILSDIEEELCVLVYHSSLVEVRFK